MTLFRPLSSERLFVMSADCLHSEKMIPFFYYIAPVLIQCFCARKTYIESFGNFQLGPDLVSCTGVTLFVSL